MNDLCSLNLLKTAVAGQLSAADEARLTVHLESCEDCCAEMDRLAGGNAWQLEAATLLSPDELDAAMSERAAWSDADFTVEHLNPSDDPTMLGQLAGYDVLGIIGRGGMGVVLKAFDRELKRFVAIKVLAPHLAHNSLARKRFPREAQAAAAVVNPHVIAIHHVQPNARLPFLIMPLLTGETLAQRLKARGPLELTEVLRIGMQAAAGLAAAHDQGLIHRDVKPANIFLEKGVERVIITDFGLARAADDVSMTRLGVVAGTPEYMSPEQARGESLDARSDLFSLGCLLFEMSTGVSPFRADSVIATLRRIVDEKHVDVASIRPDLPPWFGVIVDRLLSKNPTERFGSASEVSQLLEQCLSHLQQPSSMPLPTSVLTQSMSGRFSITPFPGIMAMVSFVGIVAVGVALWQVTTGAPQERNDAVAEDPAKPKNNAPANLPGVLNNQAVNAPAGQATNLPAGMEPQRLHRFERLTSGNTVETAVSPDGKLIAIWNSNPTLVMYQDGGRVVGDWKSQVQLVDSTTGEVAQKLALTDADEDQIIAGTKQISHVEATDVVFSPDGKLLAVGTNIGQVKIFRVSTGELVSTLDDEANNQADQKTPAEWQGMKRAMGCVKSLRFSPDGKLLVTSGNSFEDFAEIFDEAISLAIRTRPGRLKIWDVNTASLKHDLVWDMTSHSAIAFSPDGRYLATAGRWHGPGESFGSGVVIWNPRAGTVIHSLIRDNSNGGVTSIAFSPDSKQLVLGTLRFDDDVRTGGVQLVQVASGTPHWLVSVPEWAGRVQFLVDGKTIAVNCGGRSIRFLDATTGTTRHEISPNDSQKSRWNDFAIAQQADLMAIVDIETATPDDDEAPADVDSPLEEDPKSETNDDKQQPDDAGDDDEAVEPPRQTSAGIEVWSIAAISGKPAAIPHNNGAVTVPPNTPTNPSTDPAEAGAAAYQIKVDWPVRTIAVSADGRLIIVANGLPDDGNTAAADWNPKVLILDAKTRLTVTELSLTNAKENPRSVRSEVTALAISADGKIVAVGTRLGQIKLFDAQTGKIIRLLEDSQGRVDDQKTPAALRNRQRAFGNVTSLTFSPNGRQLASCGSSFADDARMTGANEPLDQLTNGRGRLKIWETGTGKLLRDLDGFSIAGAVAYSPDGKLLAGAGRAINLGRSTASVMVWNASTGAKTVTMATDNFGVASSIAISNDGNQVAVSSALDGGDNEQNQTRSTVGLFRLKTGIGTWQRAFSEVAQSVIFNGADAVVVGGPQKMHFLEPETGNTLMAIQRPADPAGKWTGLVSAKQGKMWIVASETADHLGVLEVTDPDSSNVKNDAVRP